MMNKSRLQSPVHANLAWRSFALALCILALFVPVLMPQTAAPPVVTGNARVGRLLAQMTLDEKITLIHGGPEAQPSGIGGAGTWPGLPRLGIPSLRLSDGPPGISTNVWSTGMPATMALAATWSRDDARKNGIVIGRDAKALGQDVVLEPFVNIVRDFNFGRAHNTFGEDPEGIDGKTTYSEGIFVGYRWFDQQNLKPVFPFGYGLSYTNCQYSGIKVARSKDGGLDVSFTVKNTGKAAGDDVLQIYLGAPKNPPAGAQFAVRALVQFERITLGPGQSKALTLHVELRRLQYWSMANGKWQTATGTRIVYVGASSRDIRLQADVTI